MTSNTEKSPTKALTASDAEQITEGNAINANSQAAAPSSNREHLIKTVENDSDRISADDEDSSSLKRAAVGGENDEEDDDFFEEFKAEQKVGADGDELRNDFSDDSELEKQLIGIVRALENDEN